MREEREVGEGGRRREGIIGREGRGGGRRKRVVGLGVCVTVKGWLVVVVVVVVL